MELYSNKKKYIDGYLFKDIKNYQKKGIIVLTKTLPYENKYKDSIIITKFKSKISDLEISKKIDINYIIKTLHTCKIKNKFIKSLHYSKINNKYFNIDNIFIEVLDKKLSCELCINLKDNNFFIINFKNGIISSVHSNIRKYNFQFFLKEILIISKIDIEEINKNINTQLNNLIINQKILIDDKKNIIEEYYIFLIKKIFLEDKIKIKINEKNINEKYFTDKYNDFLANFINYINDDITIKENYYFILKKQYVFKNKDINKIIKLIKKENNLKQIIKKSIISEKYVRNIITFLLKVKFIKIKIKNITFTEFNHKKNSKEIINNYYNSIKNKNYFDILDINIEDSKYDIEKNYINIKKIFNEYKNNEELEDFFLKIDEILLEIENAYRVLSNDKIKEKYFNNMLKR